MRFLLAVTLAAATALTLSAQKIPRTANGHPDLQGYWSNATVTPLERPVKLGLKEFYTEAEAAAYEKERLQQEDNQAKTDIHYDNSLWQTETWGKGVSNFRTSMIFDPPDGRLPPLSAEGQKKALLVKEAARRRESPESAQDRTLAERCITWGNEGPPMIGSTYNANLQILQTSGQVTILHEIIHGYRPVPLDGSPHLPANIRQLGGDSRGHWESDTLVVDSTNFTDKTNFRGPPSMTRQDIFSDENLHVTERFQRVSLDTINYRFTVEDPTVWSKPWSGELVLHKTTGPIYEYACHEGNYGLANILNAARVKERAGGRLP